MFALIRNALRDEILAADTLKQEIADLSALLGPKYNVAIGRCVTLQFDCCRGATKSSSDKKGPVRSQLATEVCEPPSDANHMVPRTAWTDRRLVACELGRPRKSVCSHPPVVRDAQDWRCGEP